MINDVVGSVRESFLDESVDENVLLELRLILLSKLHKNKTKYINICFFLAHEAIIPIVIILTIECFVC